jgi:cysteine desulfurase
MIYLDSAAITKPKEEVINEVINVMRNNWANASSTYDFGLESARIVQRTKEVIAKEINCSFDEIILTSGGSESNSLALDGFLKRNQEYGDKFICSTIEHSSILDNPHAKPIIFCNNQGFYKMNWIKEIKDSLVSIQFANSEIGTIQNIKDIVKILHKNNCIVHTDAVAIFGKYPIDVKDLDIDMLSATSQKIGGLCGAAFLYVKKGIRLSSIIHGTQNDGLRGGTYNVPAIAAMGKAVELITYNIEETRSKRDYLLNKLLSIDGITLNGTDNLDYRLYNNINICMHDKELDSQQLIAILDMFGYCCSAGSACHSGSAEPSKVLLNIGLNKEDALRSIRITISEDNTYEELDEFYNNFKLTLKSFY